MPIDDGFSENDEAILTTLFKYVRGGNFGDSDERSATRVLG